MGGGTGGNNNPGRPAAAPSLIAAARAGVGVAQGFLIPAIHTVLSQWVPPHERARAVSLSTSGMYLGSAMAMLALPSIVAPRWPGDTGGPGRSVALVGLLGLGWAALWAAAGREVAHREAIIPLSSNSSTGGGGKAVTAIVSGGGGVVSGGHDDGNAAPDGTTAAASSSAPSKGRPSATPWRRMLSSPAVLAIVCNNFAFHYAFYVVLNWLPTFFAEALGGGGGSGAGGAGGGDKPPSAATLPPAAKALPYLAMFACSNAGGWAGDWLISNSWRVADARKAVNAAGMLSGAAALMLMPALASRAAAASTSAAASVAASSPPSMGAAVLAATLVLSTLGFSRGGFSVNHMDIAPRHAGVVMGFSNTAGTLSGVIGVAATGWLLQRGGGAAAAGGWWAAHGVAAAGCVLAAGVFQAFARGDRIFD